MSAKLLREAAASMRERATAASALPSELPEVWGTEAAGSGDLAVTADYGDKHIGYVTEPIEAPSAEHIASWHPAVALAVADWLEAEIDRAEYRERQRDEMEAHRIRPEPFTVAYYDDETARAIAVARAYLGRDA